MHKTALSKVQYRTIIFHALFEFSKLDRHFKTHFIQLFNAFYYNTSYINKEFISIYPSSHNLSFLVDHTRGSSPLVFYPYSNSVNYQNIPAAPRKSALFAVFLDMLNNFDQIINIARNSPEWTNDLEYLLHEEHFSCKK